MLVFASIAIFYVHVSGFVLFALVSLTLIALHGDAPLTMRRMFVEIPTRALWLAPALLVAMLWALHGDGPTAAGVAQIWYMPARDRLHEFPLWANDIWSSHLDDVCGVITWCAIGFIAIASQAAPN